MAIAVRRQVVNDYRCDAGNITSEYLNRYEQYVLRLDKNELIGPMSGAEYQAYTASHSAIMKGIDALTESHSFDGDGQVLNPRGACENPVSMTANNSLERTRER
jgi:hypothetical protein